MIHKILPYAKRKLVSLGIPLVKKNADATKWGIIGLGYMAEVMALAIDGNKNAKVHAVSSRSLIKAKTFADNHGKCHYYDSYQTMINDSNLELDVIYIATPLEHHYDIIKDCLLAGKNVICEKPITKTSKKFQELSIIAKENNCFLMEAMWMKCLPTFTKAKEWIQKGNIGTIELINVNFYKKEVININTNNSEKTKPKGVLQDYGVYAIAFLTSFFETVPQSIHYHKRNSQFMVDTDWNIVLQEATTKAFINLSNNFLSESKAIILGDNGSIEWSSQFNRTNTVTLYDTFGKKVETISFKYQYQGFEYQVDEVTKAIKNKSLESSIVPHKDTFNTLSIVDKLLQ